VAAIVRLAEPPASDRPRGRFRLSCGQFAGFVCRPRLGLGAKDSIGCPLSGGGGRNDNGPAKLPGRWWKMVPENQALSGFSITNTGGIAVELSRT